MEGVGINMADYDYILITGTDRNGKRFRITCNTMYLARCYNIWRGSYWFVKDGKRTLSHRVWN